MPNIAANELEVSIKSMLAAAGASEEEAGIVARHTVGANLAGHDSHGVIQIPVYIDRIKKGHIVPGASFDIVRETGCTTVVDGNWGFGYVVSERAMQITIDKALKNGVAATTVFQQSHVGRVADYPIMAAERGLIGMMTADSGRSPKAVVPFGGREPRLGTNPFCMAIPSNLEAPFVLDMATSAAAAGKIKVATVKGEMVPSGWLLDSQGRPSNDPNVLKQGGALLPLGGAEGFKGYGLSAMVEVLSGILTGLGFGVDPKGIHNDGCFLAAFSVEAFRSLDVFKNEVTDFANYLSATPPAEGYDRVYYPGELEHMRSQDRLANGVEIDAKTWQDLENTAKEHGVSFP
jgi:uncharacterized oxidoreductase